MSRSHRAFTLVEILVVISIIGVLVALLLPAVQQAREGARRTQCRNSLHNLGIALQSYHDAHKVFPPGVIDTDGADGVHTGDEFAAWATLILPMVEEENLYASYNFNLPAATGDIGETVHPANSTAVGAVLKIFNCPSVGASKDNSWGSCTYAGVAGKLSSYYTCAAAAKENRGILGLNSNVSIKRVVDGTSRTFLCGETYWASGGTNDIVAWGRGSYLSRTTDYKPNLITGGGERRNGFRSMHSGGAFFLFADSHVQFIGASVDTDVFKALSTYAGRRSDVVVDDDDY